MPEQAVDLGTGLVAITGMMFVILGLAQYIAAFTKRQEARRYEIFTQLEACKLKNIELTAKYSNLLVRHKELGQVAKEYKALYLKYKKLYETGA